MEGDRRSTEGKGKLGGENTGVVGQMDLRHTKKGAGNIIGGIVSCHECDIKKGRYIQRGISILIYSILYYMGMKRKNRERSQMLRDKNNKKIHLLNF